MKKINELWAQLRARLKSNPEWVDAAVRYAVALLGVLLAALDLVEASYWDNITPALIAGATAMWGVLRTRQAEVKAEGVLTALRVAEARERNGHTADTQSPAR